MKFRSLSENREPTRQLLHALLYLLHPCSRTEKPFWPDFPKTFVKERNYSPQFFKKSDSKGLSLATTAMDGGSADFAGATNRSISILRQAPRRDL